MSALRTLIIIVMMITLNGCAFHLRGTTHFSAPLTLLYLNTPDPYGELAHNLKRSLKMSHVTLVDTMQDASAALVILQETPNQQLVSVSGTQQTRQYNLILTVVFQVTNNKGQPLIAPQTLTQSRTLTINSNQILGGSNEMVAMYQEMRSAIVFDIMNRLGSKELTELLQKNPLTTPAQ